MLLIIYLIFAHSLFANKFFSQANNGMPKLTLILLITLFSSLNIQAQLASVSGRVEDTMQNKSVQHAVVALLQAKDSVLYSFARTDKDGGFRIGNIKPGDYIIITTHPYFADVVMQESLQAGEKTLPVISLTSKSKLLEEVIVKTGSPIKIKGDTTVYTADSFRVRAGANVEELLKKLPGIQVDKDGKITAMGEQVKKVLVDGEEFFGDDPGIATKNLRADIVKEVQVFDKKSDQHAFTGIDDGIKDKTINLKLKDNAKKGYFGKAEAGSDLDKYYNNSLMANAFRGKRKLAGYGIMSNTGQTNLDWQDNQNYGGSAGMTSEMTEDGGMMVSYEGDGDNYWGGRGGIPKNWNGGLHYSNKFNNNKQILNTGYKFSKVNSPSGERNYTTNFVGDSSFSSNRISTGFTSRIKHNLNLTYEANIDSANSLKLTARGNLNNTDATSGYTSESQNAGKLLINSSSRNTKSKTDNSALNSTLLWKRKFKKLARTLTLNVSFNSSRSTSDSYLFAVNDFFSNGIPSRNDTTDQESIRDNVSNGISSNFTFTEPLRKDLFLSFSYNFSTATNTNNRISYSKDAGGKYAVKIDSLSNAFLFRQTTNRPGLSLRLVKKKFNYSIGASVAKTHFEQDNRTTNVNSTYDFTNFFPSASVYVKMKGNSGVRLNYNGSTRAPSLNQLQPIVDNSDPLFQSVGNPDLDQSFTHSINANYNFYNVLQERGMWMGLWGSVTQNAFVSESTIDNTGKTTYRTVNTNGVYYFNLYSNVNFKWKKTGIRIAINPNASASRNISFINNQKGINNNLSYGLRLNLSKEKENKYDISIDPGISWVDARNSINSAASAKYWQVSLRSDIEITLPLKFRFETDVNYSARQQDPRFPARNEFTIWNAELKRPILKNQFEAGFSVNDILNQNRGYERTFNDYRYAETFYNTLQRFFMFTLTWNFSKNGKPTNDF